MRGMAAESLVGGEFSETVQEQQLKVEMVGYQAHPLRQKNRLPRDRSRLPPLLCRKRASGWPFRGGGIGSGGLQVTFSTAMQTVAVPLRLKGA